MRWKRRRRPGNQPTDGGVRDEKVIADTVAELTNTKFLSKETRKRLQVSKAGKASVVRCHHSWKFTRSVAERRSFGPRRYIQKVVLFSGLYAEVKTRASPDWRRWGGSVEPGRLVG
jgi:hypothetical protein